MPKNKDATLGLAQGGAQGMECVPFLQSTSVLLQNPLQVVHN